MTVCHNGAPTKLLLWPSIALCSVNRCLISTCEYGK